MARRFVLLVACLMCQNVAAIAGEADVVKVDIEARALGIYDFTVTVSHGDTGWDHYVDRWEIVDDDDIVLGTRILLHPHINERPFMRSLTGVEIPEHSNKVTVRAHDSVHGFGGKVVTVDLTGRK